MTKVASYDVAKAAVLRHIPVKANGNTFFTIKVSDLRDFIAWADAGQDALDALADVRVAAARISSAIQDIGRPK